MSFDTVLAIVSTEHGEVISYRGENSNPTLSPIKVTILGRENEKKDLQIRFFQRDQILAEAHIEVTLSRSESNFQAVVNRTDAGKRFFQPKGRIRMDLSPLEFGDFRSEDTVVLTCESDSAFAWSLAGSGDWVDFSPPSGEFVTSGESKSVIVRVDRRGLPDGLSKGFVILRSYPKGDSTGQARDTLQISVVNRNEPIVASIQGYIKDSRGQGIAAATVTLALTGQTVVTDGDGFYKLPNPAPGKHTVVAVASGHLGAADTVLAQEGQGVELGLTLPDLPTIESVALGWEYPSIGSVGRAEDYVVVPSQDLFSPGNIAIFPFNNPSSGLIDKLPQGNSDGGFPATVRVAVETVGDGKEIFLAYPGSDVGDGRLGRVSIRSSEPSLLNIGMDPYGLILDQDLLVIAGRTPGGSLALTGIRRSDFVRQWYDTLDYEADFSDISAYGPKVTVNGNSYFLVDGAGPRRQGRVFRLDRANRQVLAETKLADPGANDVAIAGGKVFVASLASARKEVLLFDLDLRPTGAIPLDAAPHRIAFGDSGSLAGYGFVATNGPTVWVIHQLHDKPVGRIDLPGGEKARSVVVRGASGRLAIGTLDKVYVVKF